MDPRIREDDGQGPSFLRPTVVPAPSLEDLRRATKVIARSLHDLLG